MAVQVGKELVEQLLAEAGDDAEVLGPDGLLSELTKNVLEATLDAELTDQDVAVAVIVDGDNRRARATLRG